jgi:hypothetical protein
MKAFGTTTCAILIVISGKSSFARFAHEEAEGFADWADAVTPPTTKKHPATTPRIINTLTFEL